MTQEGSPVPLRPPHQPVKRELDLTYGRIVPQEQPPLSSDQSRQLASQFAGAAATKISSVEAGAREKDMRDGYL